MTPNQRLFKINSEIRHLQSVATESPYKDVQAQARVRLVELQAERKEVMKSIHSANIPPTRLQRFWGYIKALPLGFYPSEEVMAEPRGDAPSGRHSRI